MIRKDILPAVLKYENVLSDAVIREDKCGLAGLDSYSHGTLKKVNSLLNEVTEDTDALEETLQHVPAEDPLKIACYYRDEVLPLMGKIREAADELETVTDRSFWPIPTYRELLFGVD